MRPATLERGTVKRAMLVYQGGIANVFAVSHIATHPSDHIRRRLFQGDFGSAKMFCRGLAFAGAQIATAACNHAGDIAGMPWDDELDEAPFQEQIVDMKTL